MSPFPIPRTLGLYLPNQAPALKLGLCVSGDADGDAQLVFLACQTFSGAQAIPRWALTCGHLKDFVRNTAKYHVELDSQRSHCGSRKALVRMLLPNGHLGPYI